MKVSVSFSWLALGTSSESVSHTFVINFYTYSKISINQPHFHWTGIYFGSKNEAVHDNSQPTFLFKFVIYHWHVLHYRLGKVDTKGQTSPSSICRLPIKFYIHSSLIRKKDTTLCNIWQHFFKGYYFQMCFYTTHSKFK